MTHPTFLGCALHRQGFQLKWCSRAVMMIQCAHRRPVGCQKPCMNLPKKYKFGLTSMYDAWCGDLHPCLLCGCQPCSPCRFYQFGMFRFSLAHDVQSLISTKVGWRSCPWKQVKHFPMPADHGYNRNWYDKYVRSQAPSTDDYLHKIGCCWYAGQSPVALLTEILWWSSAYMLFTGRLRQKAIVNLCQFAGCLIYSWLSRRSNVIGH